MMRTIPSRTPPEDDARHFSVSRSEDGEGEVVTFKLPDFATRLDISRLYVDNAATAKGEGFSGDLVRAMAAIVGICWWGTDRVIEADFWDHRKDLLKYGHLVLQEMEDEGYTSDELARLSVGCFGAIADSTIGEEEVKEAEDFTEAQVAMI
jgi:hypothetical protein